MPELACKGYNLAFEDESAVAVLGNLGQQQEAFHAEKASLRRARQAKSEIRRLNPGGASMLESLPQQLDILTRSFLVPGRQESMKAHVLRFR
jgi:hypothetical protein